MLRQARMALLTVPDAITVHQSIGLANKAARLRYLRDRWAEVLRGDRRFEILTPDDPAMHGGITSFRIRGRTSPADNLALRKALFDRHGIFTIERLGPAKGACIRVSPSFINDAAQIDRLVTALRDLEFDDFLAPIEAALGAFREAEKARSIEAAAKRAAALLRSGEGDKEADDAA